MPRKSRKARGAVVLKGPRGWSVRLLIELRRKPEARAVSMPKGRSKSAGGR